MRLQFLQPHLKSPLSRPFRLLQVPIIRALASDVLSFCLEQEAASRYATDVCETYDEPLTGPPNDS